MKLYIFLFSFLLIGFIPYFGTIDIIGSQWFYLSILNLVFLILNFRDLTFSKSLLSIFSISYFKIYLSFILIAFISFFYTINISLTIVDFSRLSIVLLSILNLNHLIKSFNLLFLAKVITITVFIEIFFSYTPLLIYLIDEPFSSINFSTFSAALKGIAGNKNVLAFNLVFKAPFIIYFIFYSRFFYSKLLSSICLFFTLLLIFFLSSRAALFSLLFVSVLIIPFLIYSYKKYSFKSFSLFTLSILFFFLSVRSFSSISSIDISNKVQSISTNDESTSHRLTLYSNAIDYISNHPIIGCGLGNWKIESLAYWSSLMSGYTVPYHAHNDFLELSAEIGILGGGLYLFIFISLALWALTNLYKTKNFKFILYLSCLSVYFIDASFNFPLERALSQVNFVLLMVLPSINFFKND